MCEIARAFASRDSIERVHLTTYALEAIVAASRRERPKETGGILLGRHCSDNCIVVEEALLAPLDSRSSHKNFVRGVEGLNEHFLKAWADGTYYVGEWHAHPDHSAEASVPDKKALADTSQDARFQCPSPIHLIIGGRASHEHFRVYVSWRHCGIEELVEVDRDA